MWSLDTIGKWVIFRCIYILQLYLGTQQLHGKTNNWVWTLAIVDTQFMLQVKMSSDRKIQIEMATAVGKMVTVVLVFSWAVPSFILPFVPQ